MVKWSNSIMSNLDLNLYTVAGISIVSQTVSRSRPNRTARTFSNC